MTATVNQIIEQLKTLTLMETTELIDQIETVFGVDVSAPVGAMPQMTVAAPESSSATSSETAASEDTAEPAPEKEQSTFKVQLVKVPDLAEKGVAAKMYKSIREVTELGIAEAKPFCNPDELPKVIKENATKAEVENIEKLMKDAGAEISYE